MRTPEDIPSTACPSVAGIPLLGIGTWQNDDHDTCAQSVQTALELGYRHVDTAEAYGNEGAVGEGIARSSVDRDEITLATKVWAANLEPADIRVAVESSLDRLGVDVIDLLYIHWPSLSYDPDQTLPVFDALYDEGVIGRVGISNFEPTQIETAVAKTDAPIAVNQVELHPFLPQRDIVETCREHDIEVVAYSPLARGAVLEQPVIRSIADRHDATPAQVSLAWLREQDIIAIPKATGRDHIAENWQSLEIDLNGADMEKLDGIEERERFVDPDFAPWR